MLKSNLIRFYIAYSLAILGWFGYSGYKGIEIESIFKSNTWEQTGKQHVAGSNTHK